MIPAVERALQHVDRLVSVQLIAVVAATVAWLSVSGWLGCSSWHAHQQLAARRAQAQQADALIAQTETYKTAREQQARAVDNDPRLSPTQSLAEALQMLSSRAASHQLSLVVHQPPSSGTDIRWRLAQARTLREVPLALELTGHYRNMMEFLGSLSELPVLNTVRHVTINPKDALDPSGALHATVELSAFVPQPTDAEGHHPTDNALPDMFAHLSASSAPDVKARRDTLGQMKWGRDPFTRGSIGESHGLSLNGILWDAQQPMAIINSQTVRVGESIEGYTVVEIGQDSVSVTDGTQTVRLRIAP